MPLTDDQCYAAVQSRDARFDGRFFTGVRTTGIYCRPVCPARTPKKDHVDFFSSAAAAEAAGFRPCLRCRPETAPHTPVWQGTATTVSRALRLIDRGVLDDVSTEQLATRLGMGSRHLRRLFQQHVGVSPQALAQSRRTHFAKQLLEQTTLPVSQIAYTAGFSSIRRFNTAYKATFQQTPSGTRKQLQPAPEAMLSLRLSYRPPFEWENLLAFVKRRAIPGIEHLEAGCYHRSVTFNGRIGLLTVAPASKGHALQLQVSPALAPDLFAIVSRVRHLFDLDADPLTIAQHFADDGLLAQSFAERPGLRIPGAWDGFEVAVRAILGQQVSVKAASTLMHRLVDQFGTPLREPLAPEVTRLFPEPAILAEAPLEDIGLPTQRASAVRALAVTVHKQRLQLVPTADVEATIEQLLELPGIGPWTASYIAMRVLGTPDAFPHADLVLRRAVSLSSKPLTPKQLLLRAQPWQPWRAYAALHLWTMMA